MRSTGIVRRVDELGRVVLPIEIRKIYDLKEKDGIEIFTEGDTIILKKYAPHCCFCETVRNTAHFKGKMICPDCISEIKEAGR